MIPGRYDTKSIYRGINNASLAIQELRRIHQNVRRIRRRVSLRLKYDTGTNIMDRDWDYLLILDACRYDIFEKIVNIEGDLDHVISQGSHSEEFCTANFAGNEFYDTVYVTANGYGARIGKEDVFHDIIFTGDDINSYEKFDDIQPRLNALLPSTVYDAALDAYETYPNKRIIVHFMQPHQPYLGSCATKLRERLANDGVMVKLTDIEQFSEYKNSDEKVARTLAQAAEQGYITEPEFRGVYVENLRIVLKHVNNLVRKMDGKTVVTSDHGNLLGKEGIFGHPRNRFDEELRKVPWLTINSEDRPNITEEPPTMTTDIEEDTVDRQLRMLGYKE